MSKKRRKEESLEIINQRKPHVATIQEYKTVNCTAKKEIKKAKGLQPKEKLKNLKQISKIMLPIVCLSQYVNEKEKRK